MPQIIACHVLKRDIHLILILMTVKVSQMTPIVVSMKFEDGYIGSLIVVFLEHLRKTIISV